MNESTPYQQDGSQDASVPPSPVSKSGFSQSLSQVWDGALQETRARRSYQTTPSREWFERLPDINRLLLGSGGICFILGLFCIIGIPLLGAANTSVRAAVHPFTAAGKSEACLTNLQRVSLAVAQYRQDYDDKFPTTEYVAQDNSRRTWMASLRDYGAGAEHFTCPTSDGSGDGQATDSYAFNPVLADQRGEGITDAGRVLLLADRAGVHDSMLLPPFAGWPELTGKNLEKPGNIAFRHSGNSGQAVTSRLFADGHASSESKGDWIKHAATWGGTHLFTASLRRLEKQHPLLAKLKSSPPKAFDGHKVKLRQALDQLRPLQEQCRAEELGCEVLEKRAWKGAGVLRALGEGEFEQQLNAGLQRYSRNLLLKAGTEWQRHESEDGFAIEHPASWKVEQETDGRYRRTFLRSGSPHIVVLIEQGERGQPTDATVIDWSGMESSLKKQYGSNYQRLEMGWGTLDGRTVSVWEFEIKKPDAPRLRKKYFGYSTMWSSTILVSTAPAGEWQSWLPLLERAVEGYQFAS